jgi:hypothetical protein
LDRLAVSLNGSEHRIICRCPRGGGASCHCSGRSRHGRQHLPARHCRGFHALPLRLHARVMLQVSRELSVGSSTFTTTIRRTARRSSPGDCSPVASRMRAALRRVDESVTTVCRLCGNINASNKIISCCLNCSKLHQFIRSPPSRGLGLLREQISLI